MAIQNEIHKFTGRSNRKASMPRLEAFEFSTATVTLAKSISKRRKRMSNIS
jgi:hypothetical protein